MKRDKDWQIFEDYIVQRLKEIDQTVKTTKQSGGGAIKGDIKNNVGLHIEAKQRNTKSVTLNIDFWEKLKQEIPLHSNKIPVLALENKDKKRFAVLDLDDFLALYNELYGYRNIIL